MERDAFIEAEIEATRSLFIYHPPGGNQAERYERLREAAGHLAELIIRLVPMGMERSVAVAKVREAVMMANAGIACREPVGFQTREF